MAGPSYVTYVADQVAGLAVIGRTPDPAKAEEHYRRATQLMETTETCKGAWTVREQPIFGTLPGGEATTEETRG